MHDANAAQLAPAWRTLPPLCPPERPGKAPPAPVPVEVTAEEIGAVTVPEALGCLDQLIYEARCDASDPGNPERGRRRREWVALLAMRGMLLLRAEV